MIDGFKCAMDLVKNTNTALDFEQADKKLVGKNKRRNGELYD